MKKDQRPEEEALPLQVYVVDDDVSLVNVVVRVLQRAGYRAAGYSSPHLFLEQASLVPPCCLLLDVQMPGMTGPQIQAVLLGKGDPPTIVFMSGMADVKTSVSVMKAGAVDFLTKPFTNTELLDAVKIALRRSEQKVAAQAQVREALSVLARLTPREKQVCECVVRGMASKQIALELGAAIKTVNIHRSRLMKKLGVASIPELVRLKERADGSGD